MLNATVVTSLPYNAVPADRSSIWQVPDAIRVTTRPLMLHNPGVSEEVCSAVGAVAASVRGPVPSVRVPGVVTDTADSMVL